jgi:tetratricopeptide (TPR) repeat protein
VSAGLALAAHGWSRLFAATATAVSIAAIALSGTRGAWLGIIIGMAAFAFFDLKNAVANPVMRSRRALFAIIAVTVTVIASIVAISPASHTVTARARAFLTEAATGSGRIVLWRDSLKMVPAFAVIGCGPEGFRKALLQFKSRELAERSPESNNESSHNSYLDAAICYGLPGLILYIAVIVTALVLLIRARRKSLARNQRIIITGIMSSLVAVLTHNIFIFDQIPTGLYFFGFVALAHVTSNLSVESERDASKKSYGASRSLTPASRLAAATSCLFIAAAIWYCARIIDSELAYKELFNPASKIDINRLVSLGERITGSPLPSGAYDYLFARAAFIFVTKLPPASNSSGPSTAAAEVNDIRARTLGLAIEHAERSLAHTTTPELNYLLLGSLALAAGHVDKLYHAAKEAVRWDPNSYLTRRLMAEAHLVRGEYDRAESEAEASLALNPFSRETRMLLARARRRGVIDSFAAAEIRAQEISGRRNLSSSIEELIEAARSLSQAGRWKKAHIKLLTAIDRAKGACPDCHRELALLYEKMGRYSNAITQWEAFLKQAPEQATAEEIKGHIERLKPRTGLKQ